MYVKYCLKILSCYIRSCVSLKTKSKKEPNRTYNNNPIYYFYHLCREIS